MNNKDFFNRSIPAMLEKYPAPDKDTLIGHVKEMADIMKVNKEKKGIKIAKKAVIIPVIITAVLALSGAVVHEVYRIGFEESDLVTELKVGRYYLETVDGYAEDCYIEVFDDNKLQFFGIERKESFENGNSVDWNSSPVEYKIVEKIPFIAVNDSWDTLNSDNSDVGAFLGIIYEDENTLVWNVNADEYPNAKNHTREEDKEDLDTHGLICAHFVYQPPVSGK